MEKVKVWQLCRVAHDWTGECSLRICYGNFLRQITYRWPSWQNNIWNMSTLNLTCILRNDFRPKAITEGPFSKEKKILRIGFRIDTRPHRPHPGLLLHPSSFDSIGFWKSGDVTSGRSGNRTWICSKRNYAMQTQMCPSFCHFQVYSFSVCCEILDPNYKSTYEPLKFCADEHKHHIRMYSKSVLSLNFDLRNSKSQAKKMDILDLSDPSSLLQFED